ncbi:unnamed protein product [Rangifer tarandus platyrhynchus]|uniref:Uncharacterized protein n=2 Tax=Rangifer tarandus platyrhynchus TaxID=3082113 RepID=A0ACB0ETP5_RANTA|nr:unnamed protein product [Rangifer tarandus platyrhynchus]CAI9703924.1 unnamed protein product [Rangifer tarandus platyrhynchus]
MRRYSKDAGTRAPRAPDSVQGAASRRLIRAKPTSPPILSDHRRPEGPRGWTGAWAGVNSELLTLANPADKELTEGDWPAHCIHEKADSGEAGTSKVLPQEQSASDASAVTTAGGHFLRRSWFLHWTLAWAAFNHTNLPTTEASSNRDWLLVNKGACDLWPRRRKHLQVYLQPPALREQPLGSLARQVSAHRRTRASPAP